VEQQNVKEIARCLALKTINISKVNQFLQKSAAE